MRFVVNTKILCLFIVLLCTKIHAQCGHNFKLTLQLLRSTYSLEELAHDHGVIYNDLKFVVTVVNMEKNDYDFGPYLRYSYKEYKNADYYLEIIDENGKIVDFPNKPDIDWLVDDFHKNNTNKIVDTIWGIYTYKYLIKGKYRIRWVYDPANGYFDPLNPKATCKQEPTYSNWETIEITK